MIVGFLWIILPFATSMTCGQYKTDQKILKASKGVLCSPGWIIKTTDEGKVCGDDPNVCRLQCCTKPELVAWGNIDQPPVSVTVPPVPVAAPYPHPYNHVADASYLAPLRASLISGGKGWTYQNLGGTLGHSYARKCTDDEERYCAGVGGPAGCFVGIVGANPPPADAGKGPFNVGGTLTHCGPFGGSGDYLKGKAKSLVDAALDGSGNFQLSSSAVESAVASLMKEDLDPAFHKSSLVHHTLLIVGMFTCFSAAYALFSKGSTSTDESYEALASEI